MKNSPPRSEEQKVCETYWTQLLAANCATIGWGRTQIGEYRAQLATNAWQAYTRGARAANSSLLGQRSEDCGAARAALPAQIESGCVAEVIEEVLDDAVALFFDHALESWNNTTILPPEQELRDTLRAVLMKAAVTWGMQSDTPTQE